MRFGKKQQEHLIGEIFRDEYKNIIGIELEGNIEGADPPDRVFYYRGLQIGCEMFEVEQFYSTRGLFNDLNKKIYAEFESRGLKQSYEGVIIDLAVLTQINTTEKTRKRWRERKVKGSRLAQCAEELVDSVCKHISSADSISVDGLRINIDPKLSPALSAISTTIIIHKSRSDDPRRSDGKAGPLVIISSGYLVPSNNELVCKLLDKMKKKGNHRRKWQSINHSVLIIHELPREQTYLGSIIEWPEYLKIAADKAKLLETFDELWFVRPMEVVTGQDIILKKAQFICGNSLSP